MADYISRLFQSKHAFPKERMSGEDAWQWGVVGRLCRSLSHPGISVEDSSFSTAERSMPNYYPMNGQDCRIPIVIGVTGHRDLREKDRECLKEVVGNYLRDINEKYPHSPIILLSPLAEGADRLVAEVATDLATEEERATEKELATEKVFKGEIGLIVPLPMPVGEYMKDFETEASKKEFKDLKGRAINSFELPQKDSRNERYEQVGVYVAAHCQILIALWDGRESDQKGGTSKVVGFKVDGIPDKYLDYHRSRFDSCEKGVVRHVVTPRISNASPKGKPFDVKTHSSNTEQAEGRLKALLKKIDTYNLDVINSKRYLARSIEESKSDIIPEDKLELLNEQERNILEKFAMADSLAQQYQGETKRVIIALLSLVVTAVFSFHLYLAFLNKPFVLLLYPLILGYTYVLYLLALTKKRVRLNWVCGMFHLQPFARDLQNGHLDYRTLAEGLRVQLFWRIFGLDRSVSDHYLRKQKGEINWIREAIRTTHIPICVKEASDGGRDKDRRDIVVTHWVKGQADYYKGAKDRDAKSLKKEKVSLSIYAVGIALALLMFFLYKYLRSEEAVYHALTLSIAMALAISLAIKGYMGVSALSDHVKEYDKMAPLFDYVDQELKSGQLDKSHEEDIIGDLGEEALREHGDWLLLHRSRPIEPPRG